MTDHETLQRLGRLETRAELADLVGRYGHLLDDRDWDGIAACFARDGRLVFKGGQVVGRAALREFYAEQLVKNEFTFHYRHSNVFTLVDDTRATGVVSGHAEHGRGGTCVLAAVRYYDEYVLEDGAWRLASREIRSRYCLGWTEMAGDYHEGAFSALMAVPA